MVMSSNGQRRSKRVTPPARGETTEARRPRRNYARWRALCLSLVYVVFGAHILHWKLTGRTLALLELNEVMYTLELGIITAGFLFMCFLALGTLVFGRFFCSWACHIMVLQDLYAWMLRKFGIRQKPIRSRLLLLLVPPLTAFYMFIWPQIVRAWHNQAFPTFHWATDAEGWASLVTTNFWRNLPGPAIIILTFVVCGFVIVYLLGSRTFCTYVCPYGAIFALADRFSPGRIRVRDNCQQCGTCTNACTSGVRVHEEVNRHGMIVSPFCLKDLDCVGACPQNAPHYTFSRPSLFKSFRSGRFGALSYEFSILEELLIGAVFIVAVLSFRSLYSRIPFFLSLALGVVLAYLAVVAIRLFTRSQVAISTLRLKQLGRWTPAGRVFGVWAVLLAAFVVHSAFVRYHEFTGLKRTRAIQRLADPGEADALAPEAHAHLQTADRWGLIGNPNVERSMLALSSRLLNLDDVERYAQSLLERYPDDVGVRLQLGQCPMKQNRLTEAEPHFHHVVARSGGKSKEAAPILLAAHQALAGLAVRRGDFAAAAGELGATLALDPQQAAVHAQLGSALAELVYCQF